MGEKKTTAFFSISLLLMDEGKVYIVTADGDLFYKRIIKDESEHSDIYIKNAHEKRIRDLTNINNEIYSCSTDNKPIKSWKLNNGHLQMETSYNFFSDSSNDGPTCLSSYLGQNVFAVGSDYGCVSVYDSRSKDPMCRYEMRKKAFFRKWISRLAMNSEYILLLTSSFDNIAFVCDQRTEKIMKRIIIPDNVSCIKIQQDSVFIGDTYGKLHVLNPKNDFVVKSYDIGHTFGIKGVHLTYGSLITSSIDKVIISSPTDAPKHMHTLDISSNIRRMDYQNGTLALSDYDDVVRIYRLVQ